MWGAGRELVFVHLAPKADDQVRCGYVGTRNREIEGHLVLSSSHHEDEEGKVVL